MPFPRPSFPSLAILVSSCALPLVQAASVSPSASAATVAELPPVAVIASRSPQARPDIIGDVTVIDRATLERAGQNSLADVLRRQPGIEAISYGGPHTVTRLFMRGSNSNQVLVLIDGVRANAATHGGAPLNALSTSDVEHIEILRGAASSLYGADAVGGVINIIMRKPREDGVTGRASLGLGSDAARKVDVDVAAGQNGWHLGASAGYAQDRGFDATTPELYVHNPDRDSYYQSHASATVARTWAEGQELALRVHHTRINGGYDAGMPWFNDRTVQSLTGYVLTSRNMFNDRWSSTFTAAFTRDHLSTRNAPGYYDAPPDGVTHFSNHQRQFTWQHDLKLTQRQRLSVVLERVEQKVGGELADYSLYPLPPQFVNYPVTRRRTNALGAVYTTQLERHRFQLSLRQDDDSQYGGQTTGGAGYAFDITPRLQAVLAANTAFRAPDFNERFFPGSGNPDLQPEKSRNVEASLRYADAVSDASLTLYRNRVHNLIAGFPSMNIGRAILQGVTLEGQRQFGATRLRVNVDLQKPRDRDTGMLLPLRARHRVMLTAEHDFHWGFAGLEWEWVGARYGTANETERMGGYALTNLVLAYDITPRIQALFRWNNVFDRDYVLVPGYNTAGSSVFMSLSIRY